MRTLRLIFVTNLLFVCFALSRPEMIQKFDHQSHEQNVFQKRGVSCSDCHNLENQKDNQFSLLKELEKNTFKKSFKQICHQCHQNASEKQAPQTCYTCHNSPDKLQAIKPQSHLNSFWKSQHSIKAKVSSAECLNCHSQNQCIKCHTTRNPVSNNNHSRNYKNFHSIEARMSPQKCDTCHQGSFCIRCHVGGVK